MCHECKIKNCWQNNSHLHTELKTIILIEVVVALSMMFEYSRNYIFC